MFDTKTMRDLDDALELLLQCVELYGSATNHVGKYMSYDSLVDLKDEVRAALIKVEGGSHERD